VRPDGLEDAPQLLVDIDREKAAALGVGFDSINATLSTALGSAYVNDFPNAGRLQRVVVQADAPARMQPEDLLRLNASNNRASRCRCRLCHHTLDQGRDADHPLQRLPRHAHRRQRRTGRQHRRGHGRDGAPGRPVAGRFGYEWTGMSREEKLAGSQALVLYGFAILAVFLAWPPCTRAGPFRWP
jgi:multidrug efflux pump